MNRVKNETAAGETRTGAVNLVVFLSLIDFSVGFHQVCFIPHWNDASPTTRAHAGHIYLQSPLFEPPLPPRLRKQQMLAPVVLSFSVSQLPCMHEPLIVSAEM